MSKRGPASTTVPSVSVTEWTNVSVSTSSPMAIRQPASDGSSKNEGSTDCSSARMAGR